MLVVTSVGTTVAWWFIYVSGRESVDSPYLSSGVVFVGILGLIALLTAMVLCASDGDVRPLPRERDLVLSTLACFAVAAACFLFFGGDPFSAQRLLDHSAFLSGSAAVLVVVCLLAIAVFILRRVQGRAAVACIALLVPSLFLVEQGTPGSDALAGCVSEQSLNGNRAVYLAGEYVQSTGAGALIVRNGRDVAVINNCTTNWRLQDLGASIAVYGSVPVFGDSLSEPAAGQVDKVVVVGPSPRAVTRTVGGGYRASAPERVVGGIWMAVQER